MIQKYVAESLAGQPSRAEIADTLQKIEIVGNFELELGNGGCIIARKPSLHKRIGLILLDRQQREVAEIEEFNCRRVRIGQAVLWSSGLEFAKGSIFTRNGIDRANEYLEDHLQELDRMPGFSNLRAAAEVNNTLQ